jgi:hypothetical protein
MSTDPSTSTTVTTVTTETSVCATTIIAAPRQQLFDLVADPTMHPRIDGSGTVRSAHPSNPQRLAQGARFGMSMRIRLPYRITNLVVEFVEGERVAWAHFSRAVWRWEFRDVTGGTQVTETFDWTRARAPFVMRRFAPGNLVAMQRSLARLATLAAADGTATDGTA